MAEENPESTADELTKAPEAYALWNTVKLDVFEKYKAANRAVADIAQGRDYKWATLKSMVLALYIDFKPKLDEYEKDRDGKQFSELRDMFEKAKFSYTDKNRIVADEEVNLIHHPEQMARMSKENTMRAFEVIRELLERNGITHYEGMNDLSML